jgi:hypothetical protein
MRPPYGNGLNGRVFERIGGGVLLWRGRQFVFMPIEIAEMHLLTWYVLFGAGLWAVVAVFFSSRK